MSNLTFNVCKRENNENKVNLRKEGLTPGIIYGEFLKKTIPIKIDSSDLNMQIFNIQNLMKELK